MKKAILAVAAAALYAGQAFAGDPTFTGAWNVTFSLEPGKTAGATQCIVASHIPGTVNGMPNSGKWVSPTFSGWGGQWLELGDHVRWYGATTSGLDTFEEGNVINGTLTGGVAFNHFFGSGSTSSSGSWIAVRVASCQTGSAQLRSADPSR